MTTYNHLAAIAFSVISKHQSFDDITPAEILRGLKARLDDLQIGVVYSPGAVLESIADLKDMYEVDEPT